jgi:hypothetical protein
LIKSSNNGILGIIKTFDQLPKSVGSFLAVDRNFFKAKIPLLELLINCQKRTYGFWHLIKFFDQVKTIKKFDQLIMKLLIN